MPGANPADGAGLGTGARWRALDLELPAAPHPLGNYVEVAQAGALLFVSGTLPLAGGKLTIAGRLGEDVSVEQGREAARLAVLNALAAVQEHLGNLDRVKRLVKLNVYLAATGEFTEHAAVADGASGFAFAPALWTGERKHARMVSGVNSLPERDSGGGGDDL